MNIVHCNFAILTGFAFHISGNNLNKHQIILCSSMSMFLMKAVKENMNNVEESFVSRRRFKNRN